MNDEELLDEAARVLLRGPPFIVLTGAGISVESGLPPFRGPGGIWTRFDPEEYGHISTFLKDPEKAWVLLKEMISGSIKARPNGAHLSLARLEEKGLARPVITQNVDGLHRAAGSRDILDVHGDLREIYCPECGRRELLDPETTETPAILCKCGSYRRPDIVFYGEQLPEGKIERAWELASSGKDILVVGTSGVVMPVAYLPVLVKAAGGKVVEINPHPSELTFSITDIHIEKKAVEGTEALERALYSHSSGFS